MTKKHRNIGIPVKVPADVCDDPKCPWHGKLSLRGRIFKGVVLSSKAVKTAVVKWSFNRFLKKYERYERRNTRVIAYNPDCIKAEKGDIVTISECRPISKTKSFVVIEKTKQ